MPVIHCAQQLFHYYRHIHNARSEFDLKKDLARTDLNNPFFLTPFKTEKNPLFNVLNAYANYDKEIGYVQGMNIIASWLLKHLQESKNNEYTLINEHSDFVYQNGYKSQGEEIPEDEQKDLDELFDSEKRELVYNEVDAFYCLVHIMYQLKWREVFDP